jgi:hypothetical protein
MIERTIGELLPLSQIIFIIGEIKHKLNLGIILSGIFIL